MDAPFFLDAELLNVAGKIAAGGRADEADLRIMLSTRDINGLGMLANDRRCRRHEKKTFYGHTLNLNYTNVCELRCPLCAFSRDEQDANAYVMSMDDVRRRVTMACEGGADQVHIVGGLNPRLELAYYRDLIATVKGVQPDLFIVGFTATEYDYMSRLADIPVEKLLAEFKRAGVDALPGGGAEIFAHETRRLIAPKKISGQRWLDIMRLAHRAGLVSNATILYNHLESDADIVDHLQQLRMLQDETGGFRALVPLPYHGDRTEIPARRPRPSGMDSARLFAAARVYLDNFDHLKALWMYHGGKFTQALLHFGADDVGATYLQEQIVHAAGASTPDSGTEQGLRAMIRQAGFEPVRTVAGYGK